MLTRSLLKLGLRDLLRRRWQTGLMVLGVALGVAVVLAIDMANASARRGFSLSTEAIVGRATHQIVDGPSGVPDETYRQLRVDWGIHSSAPVVEGTGIAIDFGQEPVTLLGIDPIADAVFRDGLSSLTATPGFGRFYTEPGAGIIGQALAARNGLRPGDHLRIQVNDHITPILVLGVMHPADPSQFGSLDNLILMDVGGAQELLGMPDRVTRIDLIVDAAQAAAIAARLPPGLRIQPSSQERQTAEQLTSAFQLNLTALSLLALVVGMFLIYNTVLFSVLRRRTVLGILVELGVTPAQVFQLVVSEAAIVSAIGAAAGIGLGWLLGRGAVRLTTQTINDLYFLAAVRQPVLDAATVLKGFGLGLGAGIGAAILPAIEAASVLPVTALKRSSLEGRVRARLPWFSLAGGIVVVGGAGLLWLSGQSLALSFAGILAMLLGLAMLTPAATVLGMRLAGPALGRMAGLLGRMAARTVVNALSRTSVAIAALMIALSVTIGVSLMIDSFRATVVNWLGVTLRADLYVSAPSTSGTRPAASLSPGLPDRLRALPGVGAVETFRAVTVSSRLGPVALSVTDASRERQARLYRFAGGTPAQVWAQVIAGSVIVSEPFAYRHAIPPVGGSVTLQTDLGEHTFSVAGIYYDYTSDQGTVLMSDNIYHRYWQDRAISSMGVFLTPGANADQVSAELGAALEGTGLLVQANAAVRQKALAIFDRTFAITAALRVLAVVVAFIGVVSALMALQLERRRELATLQALGLPPGSMWALSFLETGLMGLMAGVLSLPTGLLLAWALIDIINLRSFGWTIRMAVNPYVFVQALLVGVAAALLAAVYPGLQARRESIAEGLRQE